MNKKLLEVYNYENKIRIGSNSDGGYVICKIPGNYDCYISCGISNEASFDRDFLNLYKNIGKNNSYAFDGTIEDYPWHYTKNINFIKKNISNINDNKHTNLKYLLKNYNNIFLSIDIEGGEYEWLKSLEEYELNKFKQICIEFHGLNDNNYGCSVKEKMNCLKKINKTHYLVHAHGNNFGPIVDNIPYVLELTYVRKNSIKIPKKNNNLFPIRGLDYSNDPNRNDFILNNYPFIMKKKEKIKIGSSDKNTKIVYLDKEYESNQKLTFIHNYSYIYNYIFIKNQLIIKRIDKNEGWGNDLVAFI